MVQPKDLIIKIPGLTLKARHWESDSSLNVLALHGWMDTSASFCPIAPLLQGINLVALDLPGHGASDHLPAGGGLHFIDSVSTVLEGGDALGWDVFTLLGHSMGAAIGTLIAGSTPARINRLVLLEGVGPLSQMEDETPERLFRALLQEKKISQRPRRTFPSMDAAVSARMTDSDLDRESARILVESALKKEGEGYCFTHDPRLRAHSRLRLSEEMVLAFFKRITCPTLFIKADKGWPFPEDLVQKRFECVANLQQEHVPGGHHVHMSHPELVAPLVNEFLLKGIPT